MATSGDGVPGGILVVMRAPLLDSAPGVRYLVEYLALRGCRIAIVSPRDPRFPRPLFSIPGITHVTVATTRRSWGWVRVPTAARLLSAVVREVYRSRPACVMVIDQVGGIIGSAIAALLGVPYVYYSWEYPEPRSGRRTLGNSLEREAIRRAALGITFDQEHVDFIAAETGLARERFLLLPNGTGPRPANQRASDMLSAIHGFPPGAVVVLHSGGFGPWFDCRELAQVAGMWPGSWRLVFHVSHDVSGDAYVRSCRDVLDGVKVVLDAKPLPAQELDHLVASAKIGLALYSKDVLGFRAELMGLASGKIGRYLKNGIPVVAQNVPSIRRYIEGYGCGVCVDGAAEVAAAITRILADYGTYQANALRCYDEIWSTEQYCAAIAERLEQIGAVDPKGARRSEIEDTQHGTRRERQHLDAVEKNR